MHIHHITRIHDSSSHIWIANTWPPASAPIRTRSSWACTADRLTCVLFPIALASCCRGITVHSPPHHPFPHHMHVPYGRSALPPSAPPPSPAASRHHPGLAPIHWRPSTSPVVTMAGTTLLPTSATRRRSQLVLTSSLGAGRGGMHTLGYLFSTFPLDLSLLVTAVPHQVGHSCQRCCVPMFKVFRVFSTWV
jgi:hypothetical protein